MTGNERLRAAITRRPVDRLPVSLQGLDPYAPSRRWRSKEWDPLFDRIAAEGDWFSFFWPTHKADAQQDVVSTSRVIAAVDAWEDVETVVRTPAGVLRSVRRRERLTEAQLEYAVKTRDDIPAARHVLSCPPAAVDVEATRQAYKAVQARSNAAALMPVPEPIDRVLELMSAETYAMLLADDPATLKELVELAAEPLCAGLRQVLETGIRPVIWTQGAEWATPPYCGPATFRELVFPYLQRIVRIAHDHGCPVISHCHGKVRGVLEMMVEAGVDATHPFEAPPSGDITPAEARRLTQDRLAFVGNVQLDEVMRAPAEVIEARIAELLDVFSDWNRGGFVLSVSGTPTCACATPQCIDNYHRLLDAAMKAGG